MRAISWPGIRPAGSARQSIRRERLVFMRMLVTGSSGLIGSEVVSHFHGLGWEVHGIDNNMRADFLVSRVIRVGISEDSR